MKTTVDLEKIFRLYGKWPSFAYLCLTALCPALALALLLLVK
jgi:hypothetical protein